MSQTANSSLLRNSSFSCWMTWFCKLQDKSQYFSEELFRITEKKNTDRSLFLLGLWPVVLVTLRGIPITQSRKKTCMTSWDNKSAVQVHDTLVTEILWKHWAPKARLRVERSRTREAPLLASVENLAFMSEVIRFDWHTGDHWSNLFTCAVSGNDRSTLSHSKFSLQTMLNYEQLKARVTSWLLLGSVVWKDLTDAARGYSSLLVNHLSTRKTSGTEGGHTIDWNWNSGQLVSKTT